MSAINCIKIMYFLITAPFVILSILINTFEKYLPDILSLSLRYGKFSYKGSPLKITIPRKWFRHFYIFSSLITCFTLGFTIKLYIYGSILPPCIKNMLSVIGGDLKETTVTQIHVLVALTLFTLQSIRRLYESHFVSVFSQNSKMNLFHYMLGYMHYAGVVVAILIEAPVYSFSATSNGVFISDLKLIDILATALFLWAYYHQHKTTTILGNLRKNCKGDIVSQKYYLPKGDWFDYLSSPHNTAEILMYFSLTVILWNNSTFLFVFLFVLLNQIESSLLSHWWYQENMENFPESRKALIPFFY